MILVEPYFILKLDGHGLLGRSVFPKRKFPGEYAFRNKKDVWAESGIYYEELGEKKTFIIRLEYFYDSRTTLLVWMSLLIQNGIILKKHSALFWKIVFPLASI